MRNANIYNKMPNPIKERKVIKLLRLATNQVQFTSHK